MGHGGETTVCSPQNHQSTHHPQVGGPNSKKPQSLTKVNIFGGGINHNHDNSKGSVKVSKKSQGHSTPNAHTKPLSMSNKPRQCHANLSAPSGNKAHLVALQQHHQLLRQQSLTGRPTNAAAPRQKSFSPPTLHPMPSSSGETSSRTASPGLPGNKLKDHFYAGARFETHPSHIGLPVPPSHWTATIQRSQSQPSSPVPTAMPQKGISVDLATLFGYASDSTQKSASFPGERLMDALMKMEDDRRKKQFEVETDSYEGNKFFGSPAQAQATNYEKSDEETDELKKALGLADFAAPGKATANFRNSHGSELSPAKYQDISVQLKTLLKVAA